MKDICNRLKEEREKLEGEIKNIYVEQLALFSFPCNCVGIGAATKRLKMDDLSSNLTTVIQRIAKKLNVEANIVYTQCIPKTTEVIALHASDLCERCAKEYCCVKGRPRFDVHVLEFKEEEKERKYEISNMRRYLEEGINKAGIYHSHSYVIELAIFSLRCGCAGLTAITQSLQTMNLEITIPYMKQISMSLGIKPNIVYATVIPGTLEVKALNSRVLCKECCEKYNYSRNRKPDTVTLLF